MKMKRVNGISLDAKIIKFPKESCRKRKSVPYQYKVKRKSVEKIHICDANLSSLSDNFQQDDDTEKYLTKSSKKTKSDTYVQDQETKEAALNIIVRDDKFDNNVFTTSSVTEIPGEYGDQLVVTLFPSSEEHSSTKDTVIISPSNSFMKIDGGNLADNNNAIFLSPTYPTNVHNSHISVANTATNDKVIYKLPIGADSNTLIRSISQSKMTNEKHHKSESRRNNERRGPLPASVEQMEDPVRTLWVTTRCHKEQLKESGHSWTTGMWSKEEVEILKQNINLYCLDRDIKDPNDIIFHATKDERKDFYPTISAGLNRPLFAVYRRVKRMYDKQNYKGKYSSEEIEKLKELRKVHGHDWTSIAQQLGRSSDSVKDRCRLLKDGLPLGTGKWKGEEEERLAKSVHTVTQTQYGESVTEGISWSIVAEMVKTRSEKQCRAKWLNYLNWKLVKGQEWTKIDDKLLVGKIASLNVMTENEVDWNKLTVGWKSARSPQWLRKKWANLKKMLNEFNLGDLSFTDTVKLLNKLFAEDVFKIWERPRQMVKFLMGAQSNNDKPNQMIKIKQIPKQTKSALEDSNNITTSIISQSDDTSTAPLFIQTTNPDHLMSPELISLPASEANTINLTQHSLNSIVRPRTSSESNPSKSDFYLSGNTLLCDTSDGPLPLSQGTYHLTPTTSDGIYIIQTSDSQDPDEVTLTTNDSRIVNITLAPDVLNSMLKLGQDAQQNDDLTLSDESVYLSQSTDSNDNPVLSSVADDITIGSQDNECDDDAVSLLRNSTSLSGSLLV